MLMYLKPKDHKLTIQNCTIGNINFCEQVEIVCFFQLCADKGPSLLRKLRFISSYPSGHAAHQHWRIAWEIFPETVQKGAFGR